MLPPVRLPWFCRSRSRCSRPSMVGARPFPVSMMDFSSRISSSRFFSTSNRFVCFSEKSWRSASMQSL